MRRLFDCPRISRDTVQCPIDVTFPRSMVFSSSTNFESGKLGDAELSGLFTKVRAVNDTCLSGNRRKQRNVPHTVTR